MTPSEAILLTRQEVASLLSLKECIAAVEDAFRRHGLGETIPPGVLGTHADHGGFHIKTAILRRQRGYFAAKCNANFPKNRERHGLPTIQGAILLHDADDGRPLAVMDSIEITILRTGAASAVAAKYLARKDSRIATVCGCGNQGRIQLRSLCEVLSLKKIFSWDVDAGRARDFAVEMSSELGLEADAVTEVGSAAEQSDVIVTCTPAKKFFVRKEHIRPGTFIAAVGADNEEKQEIEPQLLRSAKVVADIREQCAAIGDLHHAIAAGVMQADEIHAELGEVVAGRKPGRESDDEITLFDSTGTALQDVAAAAIVYEKAVATGRGLRFSFS